MLSDNHDVVTALAYHERTKHHLDRFAAGPETLDWDSQPDPFRTFIGAPIVPLRLGGRDLATEFGHWRIPAREFSLDHLGVLLELSFGLSGWKVCGPDRWAVRCNPSSGNLHPTEAYVVSCGLPGLADGLYHYISRDHALERRCQFRGKGPRAAGLWIGLSSVHWREAWKYGERAFRYCQLDTGHALAALRYAAATLGWSVRLVESMEHAATASCLGLDRVEDFADAESEEPELLAYIYPGPLPSAQLPMPDQLTADDWRGHANRLDTRPMYRWPVIEEVSTATRRTHPTTPHATADRARRLQRPPQHAAAELILRRRSAQRFDPSATLDAGAFFAMLEPLLANEDAPWDVWDRPSHVHLICFVHKVTGLEPGLYALPRNKAAVGWLRERLSAEFAWVQPDDAPARLPLYRLLATDCRRTATLISCRQSIAGQGCFAVSMLGAFDAVRDEACQYRYLHWEAGLLGQVLYLEAEAAGLRGTGVGCFFDNAVHQLLGITSNDLQAIYHFTVGHARDDARITTEPAYPGRRD